MGDCNHVIHFCIDGSVLVLVHGWEYILIFHQYNGAYYVKNIWITNSFRFTCWIEGYGAYYYYNDTQQRLATLRDNNAKLEVVNKEK